MTMLAIRKYEETDWERLQAIHDAARRNELALAGLEAAFLPLAEAADREGLFDYQVAVAELDGEAAGFAAYSEEEVAWLYVDPAMGRRGVGRALGRYALERMGRPAAVEVLRGNEPALALYRSLGFQEKETVTGRMPGNEAFTVTVRCLTLEDQPPEER